MSITLEALGDIPTGLDVAWPAESSWLTLRRLLVLNHVTPSQLRAYLKQCAAFHETDAQASAWTCGGLARLLAAQTTAADSREQTKLNVSSPKEPFAEARHWVPAVLARWHCVSHSLRICHPCMNDFGFHAPFFQLLYFRTCPIHGTTLTENAPCCGRWLSHKVSLSPYLCEPCGWTGPSAATLQTRPEPPPGLLRFIEAYQRFLAACDHQCVTVPRDRDGVCDVHPALDYTLSGYAMDDVQQQAAQLFQSLGLHTLSRCAVQPQTAHTSYFTMQVSSDLPVMKLPKIKKMNYKYDLWPPRNSRDLDQYYEALRQGIRLPYNSFNRLPNRIIAKPARSNRSQAHTVSGHTGPRWARYVTRDVDRRIQRTLIRRMPNCRHLSKILSTKVPAGPEPDRLTEAPCPPCLAFWLWRYAVSIRNAGINSVFGSVELNLSVSDHFIPGFRSPTLVGVGRLAGGLHYQVPVRLRAALLRADLLRLFCSLLVLCWHDRDVRHQMYPTVLSFPTDLRPLLPSIADALYWTTEHYRSYVTLVDDDNSAQMILYSQPDLRRFEELMCCPEPYYSPRRASCPYP